MGPSESMNLAAYLVILGIGYLNDLALNSFWQLVYLNFWNEISEKKLRNFDVNMVFMISTYNTIGKISTLVL